MSNQLSSFFAIMCLSFSRPTYPRSGKGGDYHWRFAKVVWQFYVATFCIGILKTMKILGQIWFQLMKVTFKSCRKPDLLKFITRTINWLRLGNDQLHSSSKSQFSTPYSQFWLETIFKRYSSNLKLAWPDRYFDAGRYHLQYKHLTYALILQSITPCTKIAVWSRETNFPWDFSVSKPKRANLLLVQSYQLLQFMVINYIGVCYTQR